MQNFAFAPEGFDTEANIDVLLFVPTEAETWSATEAGAGYAMRDRATGELTAYLPFGTHTLPAFTEDDKEAARLAALDIQSGAAFG
jgi:hypothetical protein